MSLKDKYSQFCLSHSCYPDDKKTRKIEELDTYDYIFFLTYVLDMPRTDAFRIGCDYKLYRYECGPVGFGRESIAAAFIYRFQSSPHMMSKYKICEEAQINISSFDRMLRKIDEDIFENEYLCKVYCINKKIYGLKS
jgi:hypothetical protein